MDSPIINFVLGLLAVYGLAMAAMIVILVAFAPIMLFI
jgi:hypothetical protein